MASLIDFLFVNVEIINKSKKADHTFICAKIDMREIANLGFDM